MIKRKKDAVAGRNDGGGNDLVTFEQQQKQMRQNHTAAHILALLLVM